MTSTSILSFNPNAMPPEILEKIFVQRHQLAENLIEQIRESATTNHKSFQLLIGMRGIGKTHLISLIYHRVAKMEEVPDKLLIAWLREEEWGVESFLDLLFRIFRALEKEYPTAYKEIINQQVEALYQLQPDEAEQRAAKLLKEFVGERTLLLLMENLDELFKGFTKTGQKQFLDYLKTDSFITILATSTSTFAKKSPLHDFFTCQGLESLNIDDAAALLQQIAELEGNTDLSSFMQTPTGRARIEAIHQLAGGNPRVYVIFSQFLRRKSLDELVEPFMQTLNELTPYYQARMQSLSSQQRKIIEFLVDRRNAVSVKEIAKRCFISQQTTSSQLKKLYDMGYVCSTSPGRESYYELREVLMRFCLEVKKQRGEVVRLFVDFLRLWCTKEELQERLEKLSVAEMSQEMSLERAYLSEALKEMNQDSLQLESNVLEAEKTEEEKEAETWFYKGNEQVFKGDFEQAIASYDKALSIKPDYHKAWGNQGNALCNLGQHQQAIASYDNVLDIKPDDHKAWNNRGVALYNLGRLEEAVASYDKALSIKPDLHEAWNNRGIALGNLGRLEEAVASYDQALSIKPDYHQAWNNRGTALYNLGRLEEAVASYDQALSIKPDYHQAWNNRGNALDDLGQYEQAVASYDKALSIKPDLHEAWNNRGIALGNLGRLEEAVASYDQALSIKPDYHQAWNNRGTALYNLGRLEEAVASYDQALSIKPDDHEAWYNRGIALRNLGQYEQAVASYDQALSIQPDYHQAWFNRGIALRNLGQYEQAVASYDQALSIQPDYHQAWFNRGWALICFGQYEEALRSCEKAIELGDQSSGAFFNRAITLLGLNLWEKGITSLEEAFNRLKDGEKTNTEYAELILRDLFNNTKDAASGKTRLTTLIELYNKYQALSTLGMALVRQKNIDALMSDMVSDKTAQLWLEIWQQVASDYPVLQIPLRLLGATVSYRLTKGDERALLELPIEERKLLKPLLQKG